MGAVELETFANGLRVVWVPCEAESVAFGVFVASGSRHEPAELSGISHFIEHMLFKGTPTRTALQMTQAIEGCGGHFNASTGEDSTCYWVHVPSEHLAEAVETLADMCQHASMDAMDFARERAVILEEIKMYADEPDAVAMENLQSALFPSSSLGRPVSGTRETLLALRPEVLRRYVKTHYVPERMVLVLAGQFELPVARQIVRTAFGRLRAKATFGYEPFDAAVRPRSSVRVTRDIAQAQYALGYRAFGIGDTRQYAATVLDAVLGRGMSSRLFQAVREKRGLSYDISSRLQFFEETGFWVVAAGLDIAHASSLERTIQRELVRLQTHRVPSAELRRTKEFLIGNFRLSHEKVTSKMFYYGSTLLAFGRLVKPSEQIEAIAAVSASEVQAVAEALFRTENQSTSWVVPR